MKTTTGDDGYIHLLLEHQSSAEKNMAFRQLRYAVAAMQRHLEAGHKKLPLVIPVLFYHGNRSPYPFSTRWLDCFSNPEQAGKVYTNGFPLVDVTVIDDDEIMHHRRMAALTLLMKHIRQRDMIRAIALCTVSAEKYLFTIAEIITGAYASASDTQVAVVVGARQIQTGPPEQGKVTG